MLEEKTHHEKELARVKVYVTAFSCFHMCLKSLIVMLRFLHLQKEAGALERVELDACRQQLELEKNRSQTLQQRLMENPVCPSFSVTAQSTSNIQA